VNTTNITKDKKYIILTGEFDNETIENIKDFLKEKGWDFIKSRGLFQMMINEEVGIKISKDSELFANKVIVPCRNGFFTEDDDTRVKIHRIVVPLQGMMSYTFTNKFNKEQRRFFMEVA
jgi:hypothetical protein